MKSVRSNVVCRVRESGFRHTHPACSHTMPLRACAASAHNLPLRYTRKNFCTSAKILNSAGASIRVYRYVIDVHGQLFLHDTVPKNLTSCFKNTEFLDFFHTRIRPNPVCSQLLADPSLITRQDILTSPASSLAPDWSDVAPFNGKASSSSSASKEELWHEACGLGSQEGFQWISPCGPELNLIRTQDTPIVFHELSEDGNLRWAGTRQESFRPDELMVDPTNGYVYHPSPLRPNSRRKGTDRASPYGKYSLLGSNLVLSRFADGLEIDPDVFHEGQGGSIEWHGRRYQLGLLPVRSL